MARHSYISRFEIVVLAALLAVSAVLQSCDTRGTDEVGAYETFNPNTQVSYPMLQHFALSSCMGCHSNFSDPNVIAGLIDPSNPEDSVLLKKVEDGEMPKGGPPLSANQIAMIRAFITQQQAVAIEPTWSSLKIVLINRSCVLCHRPGHRRPYMDTYDRVLDHGYDMADELLAGHMPPKNHPRPSEEVIRAFVEWYLGGAPHN